MKGNICACASTFMEASLAKQLSSWGIKSVTRVQMLKEAIFVSLIPQEKAWIHLFFLQLWVNSLGEEKLNSNQLYCAACGGGVG